MSSTTRSLANCTSQWLSTVHTTTNGRLTSSTPPISPAIQPSSLTYHLPNSASPRFILRLQSQALSFRLPTCIESTMNPLRASMPPNKYVYPDPIPEFAESETLKFKTELWHKLLKDKETFGDDLDHVVEVCTETIVEEIDINADGSLTVLRPYASHEGCNHIFSQAKAKQVQTKSARVQSLGMQACPIFGEFLHKEYGGPGTLLVEPFTDMLIALKERKLPGAPLAARTSLLWAQNYVDQDWEVWNSRPEK
ncbi:hypothetical protein FEM48_Zijuj10G0061400 [Ziziphus jujuba var. spinosa]|uniref:Protein PLASTID REDOX INSENSITIVE 2, chloroplastic-like n=1 Tax=Ziziphus jujuba var. spinosa TaxID=714518 RepID=A0A978ULR8_ZIZJJ|nr:hypothetical protein FEM48_Zijuj10G0061400 [Ziziphus jujuba var. spinosa]